jgi:hypothetical protein
MVDFRHERETYDAAILGSAPADEELREIVARYPSIAAHANHRMVDSSHQAFGPAPAHRLTPEQELAIAMA